MQEEEGWLLRSEFVGPTPPARLSTVKLSVCLGVRKSVQMSVGLHYVSYVFFVVGFCGLCVSVSQLA